MCTEKKLTKEEVDYGPSSSPAEHRCGICAYRLPIPGTDEIECGIVEGSIEKLYGCKLYDVDLIAAANDKHNLETDPPKS